MTKSGGPRAILKIHGYNLSRLIYASAVYSHLPSKPMAQTQATTALAQVEIEGTPDIEIIPGTETLTDIDGARFVHGGRSNVVLVPRPSSDLHDPLVFEHIHQE